MKNEKHKRQRALFENWWSSQRKANHFCRWGEGSGTKTGDYCSKPVNDAWKSWLACFLANSKGTE